MTEEKEERFSIHIRAWGAGLIIWIIGFTVILSTSASPLNLFMLLLLAPVIWVIIRNERLPGGIEK